MIGFKQTAMAGLGFTGASQAGLSYNVTDLGTLGGNYSTGNAINASGQVTGFATTANGDAHAFIANNGVMSDLGAGQGHGINASGQVTGGASNANGSYHAFITNNGVMSDLGTLGGNYSSGNAINASGQVTGSATTANGPEHAFITNNGVMTDLGTLGGNYSTGNAINASGQVTGYSTIDNGSQNAFNLPVPGPEHAFITNNGVMTDLNTLLVASATDWVLNYALGINDSGQITGSGVHNGLNHAFLLTPVSAVPVPGAVWLFGSGLIGLLSFNRRKNKTANLIAA